MENLSRKAFLQKLAILGVGSVGAAGLLNSCGGGDNKPAAEKPKTAMPKPEPKPAAAADDPCGDLTGLSEAEANMRNTFKYIAESNVDGKNCENCQLYILPKEGESCGGCTIIKGPIAPNGYCMQWIVKQG